METEFDALITELYQNHVNKMKSSLKNSPSSFWKFLNSKKNTNSFPKLLHYGSHPSTDQCEQASLFAEFFSSNFSATAYVDSHTRPPSQSTMPNPLVFNEYFIFDELLKIKTSIINPGPDGIHPLVLQKCASILYEPLTHIFNESLATGIFPDAWKRYSVEPIFKKGMRSNISN